MTNHSGHAEFQQERRHTRHLRETRRAYEILSQGGFEAAAKLPLRIGALAKMEALLARSWAVRHESSELMVQFALLATQCAEQVSVRAYGIQRVFDFRCRAQAELGNAFRVADLADKAEVALSRAWALFQLGTKDEALEMHLLDFEASLDVDNRRFASACSKLKKVHQYHIRQGDPHRAGRALLQLARATRYMGNSVAALQMLKQSMTLIDAARDPMSSLYGEA